MKKDKFKRVGCIINPNCKGGKLGKKVPTIGHAIKKLFPSADLVLTNKKGDATEVATRMSRDDFDLVLVLGGDGTLNETVNGLYNARGREKIEPVLGIIPSGTGNDFCRMLNMPNSFSDSLEIIKKAKVELFDFGVVKLTDFNNKKIKKCFINISDFGIIGDVVLAFNRLSFLKKTRFGFIPYIASFIKKALLGSRKGVIIKIDDEDEAEHAINNINIANGMYYGSGVNISPNSDPQDGYFNLVMLENMSPLEFTYSMLLAYRGDHLRMKNVISRKIKRIKAFPAKDEKNPIHIDLDGESPGKLPAEFYIVEKSIQIIVP